MRLTLKLSTENQGTETVRLGSQVVEKAKDAVEGLNDGRISYDDARDIIITAASTGFGGGALSDDELKFLEFLAGPGAAKRINIVTTGEELSVRVTDGKRSGTSALSRGSAPWTAAKSLIITGVEDRARAEFGRDRNEKLKVTAHQVKIDSPQDLETMINELMAQEAAAYSAGRRRPLVFEAARVFHSHSSP